MSNRQVKNELPGWMRNPVRKCRNRIIKGEPVYLQVKNGQPFELRCTECEIAKRIQRLAMERNTHDIAVVEPVMAHS